MTRVCLVGRDDVTLQYELLSRETARDALTTYDVREPFENAVGVETVSLGAAVSLLNDLNWYLVRFVDEAMVLEPSVSETEWLSRDLAAAVRDDEVSPEESARFLKVYGLESPNGSKDGSGDEPGPATSGGTPDGEAVRSETSPPTDDGSDGETNDGDGETVDGAEETRGSGEATGPKRLVEPMYVTRTGDDIPDYDLRDVEDTLVERVTEDEFGA